MWVAQREKTRFMGSHARLAAVLGGGDWLAMAQDGVKQEYLWRRVGDNAQMPNAYDVAKAGGRHAAWMREQQELGERQLRSARRSIQKQVALHLGWLDNPTSKVQDWNGRSALYQQGLLRKWQQDIQRQRQQIEIIEGVMKEKGHER